MANPLVADNGVPMSGPYASLPTNASTGNTYYAQDTKQFFVYDDAVPGWVMFPIANTLGTGVGYGVLLKLADFKNPNGTTLAATASAGEFGISSTPGTSLHLLGEAAESDTRTDSCIIEFDIPQSYVPGTPLTVIVSAQYNAGSPAGTVPTCTVAAAAYLVLLSGGQVSNLIATAAKSMIPAGSGVAADYYFTITGTGLVPAERLLIEVTTAITEGGGTGTLTAQVNSVRIQ
jgi:hypothetical protein